MIPIERIKDIITIIGFSRSGRKNLVDTSKHFYVKCSRTTGGQPYPAAYDPPFGDFKGSNQGAGFSIGTVSCRNILCKVHWTL